MSYPLSGQLTVTTAGTVVQFTSTNLGRIYEAGTYRIKPLIGNTGAVFIGYPGTTALTTANGYELTTGRDFLDVTVDDLNVLYLDAANDGDGVCFHRIVGQIVGIKPPA